MIRHECCIPASLPCPIPRIGMQVHPSPRRFWLHGAVMPLTSHVSTLPQPRSGWRIICKMTCRVVGTDPSRLEREIARSLPSVEPK